MTSIWDKKIIKILVIVPPWLLLIGNFAGVDFIQPDIQVSLEPTSKGNLTSTEITILNTGKEPATGLRITLNPFNNIVSNKTLFYTETIRFESTGPQNLIGLMDRLANDQKIVLETTLNVSLNQFRNYNVHVTHDDGSTNYYYNSEELPVELQIVLSISWATILTLFIWQRFETRKKKNIEENFKKFVKEPVEEIKKIVSEIPPDPFIEISLDKESYKQGDTVKAKWVFSGLSVGETLWAGVFDSDNNQIENKRFNVEKSAGEFSSELIKISKLKTKGVYVVKTDTQFGPESSAEFNFI